MTDPATPRLFRVLLPAKDLAESRRFYEALLGVPAREVAGGRLYFDCGPVILGVLDHSSATGPLPTPAEAFYFATESLEEIHRRAMSLGATAHGFIHGDPSSPMGEIGVRPWGERSFYATDPSGNALCFVDSRTLFTGTPEQVAALRQNLG